MISKRKCGFIPEPLFSQIVDWMPIASVEAVTVLDGSLLFLKRKNPPAAGLWWFAGGRIHKGESFEDALHREVKEETGLEIESLQLINVYSRVFSERHDITILYLCKCKGKVVLDNEHLEYMLLKEPPADLHPYLQEVIIDCAENLKGFIECKE
ncbi:MAG: NUDIX domain-containing protein [Candidatus Bathyarchaeota archaeon]|nr:NUDIX domain-containing protein [Candidatus Bathyarchaeota archaeon]